MCNIMPNAAYKHHKKGFLLVDALTSIIIVAVALVAIVNMLGKSTESSRILFERQSALLLAETKMEHLQLKENKPLAGFNVPNDEEVEVKLTRNATKADNVVTKYTIKYSITNNIFTPSSTYPFQNNMKLVTVDVSWPATNKATHTVSLQQYLYLK